MGIDEILKDKRDAILKIAAKHGARKVRVFGSIARGEAGPQSDVDFLVRMDQGRSFLDFTGLWLDLEDLMGCKVDLVSEGGISPHFRDRIFAEAVSL